MTDIVLQNLTKTYGELTVLQDVCATLPAGHVTCLMARSGGGKTTLLRLLAGLERPDSGEIHGRPGRCAFVFQEDRLCEAFSAIQNIKIAVPRERHKDIAPLLSSLLLDEEAQRKPVSALSGGMRRRLAIARALLAEGDLLLLDEPFKGLDEETRDTVLAVVKALLRGRTTVLATHDARDAVCFAARVLTLEPEPD